MLKCEQAMAVKTALRHLQHSSPAEVAALWDGMASRRGPPEVPGTVEGFHTSLLGSPSPKLGVTMMPDRLLKYFTEF